MFRNFFVLIVLVSLAFCAQASDWTAQPYGFASFRNDYNHDHGYAVDFVRPGVNITNQTVGLKLEVDLITSKVKHGYVSASTQWQGGKISLLAGQFLTPAQWSYPSAFGLRTTRYPDAELVFSGFTPGICAIYENPLINLRVANFSDNRSGARLALGPLSVYWEEFVGYGAVFDYQSGSRWLNPYAGWTKFDDKAVHVWTEDRTKEQNTYFVQNHIQVYKPWLRLYGEYDFGDLKKDSWLVGVNAEWHKESFVKVFYDTRDESLTLAMTVFAK